MPKQQKNNNPNNNKSSEEKRRRKSLNKMNNNNKKRKKQQQYYNNYKNRSRASSSSITTSADIINDNTPYVSIFKEHYLPPPSSSLNNNNNQSTNNNSNNLQQKNLHGYYFDSERNRYFPIPKNGLERSISKLVNLPPPSSLKMYSSSFLENNKVSSFNKNVINNNNTLINRKKSLFTTKLKQSLFTNIKKDFTFCNLKYYLNENNFKLLEDVSKENLQVFHFENKIYSSSTQNTMFILTELKEEEINNIDDEKRLSVRQQIMLNCSTKIANSTVMDINEDNVKILISEMGGNYKSGSLNLLTFKSPFHFNTQNIYNVNKRTIYCHSINRNNLCSIGLTKGGIVYNLENKKIINYLNSNYSDIIVQKWINEDELIYSDRNSNFYLWDKRNKKEESFKNENEWINDICILNDNQWIVKSVSKSQNQMNMYCYDKRKLNQSIMTYEIPKNQLVMKNLLQDCKLFILNNKWLMLGSETIDEKSILRIWDIYNGKLELSLTNDNDWEGPITNIASLSTANNNNEMLFLGMNNGIAYSTQPLIL
ncbi:hypothetical protein ABK040_006683 [Willaertia magna]